MNESYSPNYGEPKYKSQSLVFDRLKVVFDDAIKERDELLSNQKNNENKDKIVKVDLRIAMCIKKRARFTKGGYSYLPEEMYDWEPVYKIDKRLLPKTVS